MTNRERLDRAIRDIEHVRADNVIGPTAYTHLTDAYAALCLARRFALDETEQDTAKFNRTP